MKSAPASPRNGPSCSPVTREEQRAQLERILRSETFRPAPGLHRFLEFVASKTIEGSSRQIKEYTIGTEVFDRSAEYDPRIDTIVRVQAHRLREKLKEYYSDEGVGDEILLIIPKGHYVPCFFRRAEAGAEESEGLQAAVRLPEAAHATEETLSLKLAGSRPADSAFAFKKQPLFWLRVGFAGMALLLGVVFLLSRILWWAHPIDHASPVRVETFSTSPGSALNDLWADFLRDDNTPIVAYSNAVFLTDKTSDLLRLKSEDIDNLGAQAGSDLAMRLVVNHRLLRHAGPVFFEDLHTGTGEVMAVFYLTRMFSQFRASLGIKRSRLVTTDDLSHHNVIFLGLTKENALLAGLPLNQDFVTVWPEERKRPWDQRIANLHPRPGENASYEVELDPKTSALRADYGLISFLPGITPNRRIAVLGGLTTLGTQAAAEFATSASQIADLLERNRSASDPSHKKVPPSFQAVIRAEIVRGDILNIKYVTAHVIPPP